MANYDYEQLSKAVGNRTELPAAELCRSLIDEIQHFSATQEFNYDVCLVAMDIDRLKRGSAVAAPTVSASMATAALAYSGITVKMLVDQRLDAQQHTMFMVDYQPGAVAHPHDHPFEEAYYMLDGEVDVVAHGERHTLRPGDFFWTGTGCVHAFYETQGGRVRWLETSAPGPPARHSYRFERDWDYLVEILPPSAG